MRRWAAFRRKGAKILTVLLVVVLSVVNICSTLEIVQLALGDFTFYIGPLTPMSPHCKTKTGAAMGKSQDSARFDLRYSVVFYVSIASCTGMEGLRNGHDLPIHATVSVGLMMI
jgi:hypothetical protein